MDDDTQTPAATAPDVVAATDPLPAVAEAPSLAETLSEALDEVRQAEAARGHKHARIDALIASWYNGLRNSPVSRNTESWNHITAELPHLATAIKQEV